MSRVGNNRVKVAQRKVAKLPYKHKSLKLAILDKISVYRVNIVFSSKDSRVRLYQQAFSL